MTTPEPSPELDIEQPDALVAYLRASGKIQPAETPRIDVLQGGVSNKTVLVEHQNGAWVLKQALPKLRVKVDWFSDPRRIHREALALQILPDFTPPATIPGLIFEDEAKHILAMEAVPQPHENWKLQLLRGELDMRSVGQFAAILAGIHRGSARQPKYEAMFGDRAFFESLRLEPYYAYTGTQVERAAAFMTALIADTLAQQLAIVHGDYSPKNILVLRGRLILLDHEVIHYGDPAFDVGFGMTHFLSKAHHLEAQRADFAEAAQYFWRLYSAYVSETFTPFEAYEARAVRHVIACMLARAAGRSPLEYLAPEARERQLRAVLRFIDPPPVRMSDFIKGFIAALDD